MKGQTSVEWLFIAAIVLTVAAITLVSYSEQTTKTVIEATLRNQVELAIAKQAFNEPKCAGMQIDNMTYFNDEYYVYIEPTECADVLDPYADTIKGRISEALGCRYDADTPCRGQKYNIWFM